VKQNPPQKHHYIPEFYLKRWVTGADNRLWQFSKPYRQVVAERKYPSETGFVRRLYSTEGTDERQAHRFEEFFFKPVDSAAAEALQLMEKHGNAAPWDSRLRSAWSRFIHSLLVRCPEDMSIFKRIWRDQVYGDATGEWEVRYQAVRDERHPPTLREAMEGMSEAALSASTMRALMSMIDNASLGEKMNRLPWHILELANSRFDLLTSDRPIIRTNGIMVDGGHIALPIGPRKVFIAGKDGDAIQRIVTMDHDEIVRQVNERVVTRAVRFVWSTSSRAKALAEKRMSTEHDPRLLESLANKREETNKAALEYYDEEVAEQTSGVSQVPDPS
jgi:hypothetical protein